MPGPRRSLAALLAVAALGLAACGDDAGSGDAQKSADEVQKKADDLQQKSADLAEQVKQGKKTAQEAADELQQDAKDLGGSARKQAQDALNNLQDKVPAKARDDVQKAIDELAG